MVLNGTGNFVAGGTGDDVYILMAAAIRSSRRNGGGTDTVYAYTSLILADHIETLVLISADLSVAQDGLGNALANTIIGNGTVNTLSGGGGGDFLVAGGGNDTLIGGTGLDVLQGNSGADRFLWNALVEVGDVIQDFVSGEDKLVFDASAFIQFGPALVEGVNFVSNTAPIAATANATFLWDSDDTVLYFDADGTGTGGPVLVADLQAFSSVTVADISFINLPRKRRGSGREGRRRRQPRDRSLRTGRDQRTAGDHHSACRTGVHERAGRYGTLPSRHIGLRAGLAIQVWLWSAAYQDQGGQPVCPACVSCLSTGVPRT